MDSGICQTSTASPPEPGGLPVVLASWDNIPYVVAVCDNARERCPIFPGTWKFLHWSFEDPVEAQGTHEERLAVFRRVRDAIIDHIDREFVQGDIARKRAWICVPPSLRAHRACGTSDFVLHPRQESAI